MVMSFLTKVPWGTYNEDSSDPGREFLEEEQKLNKAWYEPGLSASEYSMVGANKWQYKIHKSNHKLNEYTVHKLCMVNPKSSTISDILDSKIREILCQQLSPQWKANGHVSNTSICTHRC